MLPTLGIAPLWGNADGHEFGGRTFITPGVKGAGDDCLAPFGFLHSCAQFHRTGDRSGPQIADLEGGRDTPDAGLAIHGTLLDTVMAGDCKAHGVTVDDGGDNAAVEDVFRPRGVLWRGPPDADSFIAVPLTLDLQTLLVERSTPPAMISWDEVLECGLVHR